MSVLDHSCASLPARLTKEELSAYLGITPELLGVHTRAGKISATKLGRQWVYGAEDVRAYLAASQNARACAALTDKYGLFTGRESALVAHLPDLVPIKEASQFLGFTSEYVNDLCLGHLLAAVKVGRSWLIPRSGLAAFLYARTAHA